jgi:hypothetical protein
MYFVEVFLPIINKPALLANLSWLWIVHLVLCEGRGFSRLSQFKPLTLIPTCSRLQGGIALSSKATKAVKCNGSKRLELIGERLRRMTINNDAKRGNQ